MRAVRDAGDKAPVRPDDAGPPTSLDHAGTHDLPLGADHARLEELFELVRAGTGRNFAHYKSSTILRRTRRRMRLSAVPELGVYVELLRSDQDEVRRLADDLLINVSSFFRDPAVWQVVAEQVVPELFRGRPVDQEIRVWSAGCATGEEVYTIAMLLSEEAERLRRAPRFRLLATDLHERCLVRARDGRYSSDIEEAVHPDRLRRFFHRVPGGYRVNDELRETVVFAVHDLGREPPVEALDLVCCRNVLIYLQHEAQRQVTLRLRNALRPGGYLLLGMAERMDTRGLLQPVSKRHCLHRRAAPCGAGAPQFDPLSPSDATATGVGLDVPTRR